mgnify:FL=1
MKFKYKFKEFFPHSIQAANDIKIEKLIRYSNLDGYGFFWIILENMAKNPKINLSINDVNYLLQKYNVKPEVLDYMIEIKLLYKKNNYIYSKTLQEHFKNVKLNSEQNRKNIISRYQKNDLDTSKTNLRTSLEFVSDLNKDTYDIRAYNDRNTSVIQSKEKKRKENKSIQSKNRIILNLDYEKLKEKTYFLNAIQNIIIKLCKKENIDIPPNFNIEKNIRSKFEYFNTNFDIINNKNGYLYKIAEDVVGIIM